MNFTSNDIEQLLMEYEAELAKQRDAMKGAKTMKHYRALITHKLDAVIDIRKRLREKVSEGSLRPSEYSPEEREYKYVVAVELRDKLPRHTHVPSIVEDAIKAALERHGEASRFVIESITAMPCGSEPLAGGPNA